MKLPSMTKHEIRSLIQRQALCRIAFRGTRFPYVAPFHYVTVRGILYFHLTNYGKKIRMLGENRRVCVEIEEYEPDLSSYRFVSLRGKLEPVTDPNERTEAIKKFSSEGKRRLSRNFLLAHGFDKNSDWSSFDPQEPLMIMKLVDIHEIVGLRSL